MTDWRRVLIAIEPRGKPAIIDGFAASLDQCTVRAVLTNKLRLAHFLSQTAHESAGYQTTVEYASGAAYEGRRDLGNVVPGDGKRYRGRGLIQLTGRANYSTYGAMLGVSLEGNPPLAAAFPYAALTAAEYWNKRKINAAADADDVVRVTKIINGGTNGLADRKVRLARAQHALSDLPAALTQRATEIRTEATTQKRHAGIAVAANASVTGSIVAAPEPVKPHWAVPVAIGGGLLALAIFVAVKSRNSGKLADTLETEAHGAANG
jgi:putative chitinase